MSVDIVMPRLSDSMEEGTILAWVKSVGDEVTPGEELVEIETDKANMVFEADAAGTLIEILASAGETLPIGALIARIGEPSGAKSGAPPAETAKGPEPRVRAATSAKRPASPAARPADDRVKATPLARRIAAELGVDLAVLSGSGPGGRVMKGDVESMRVSSSTSTERTLRSPLSATTPSASSSMHVGSRSTSLDDASSAKGRVEIVEPTKLQQTVARRMAESKATAPHFYLRTEVDMSAAVAARSRLKAAAGDGDVVPSLNDLVVKASAIALTEHRRVNGAYRDGRFELYGRVNVGVAVAARDALVVPTIFDADLKALTYIARETRALAVKVREGSVVPPELSGGTFTITNLGMYGMESIGPVLSPPQAAILGVGEIAERPIVRDGKIITAMLMAATLACDHRIIYGAEGAMFLSRVRAVLEEPLALAL